MRKSIVLLMAIVFIFGTISCVTIQKYDKARSEPKILFSDNFKDGDFTNNPRWYYENKDPKVVIGIEGDAHTAYLYWEVLDGYLSFSEGDFIGLNLMSNDISIPAGVEKLVIEYDTFLGGAWAHYNLISLEDSEGNVIFGGGIYCDGYNNAKGKHETNNGLMIIDASERHVKELLNNSVAAGVWKHVTITFDSGSVMVSYDNGAFTFNKSVEYTQLTEIQKIKISGWQHTSGAKFDNITVAIE